MPSPYPARDGEKGQGGEPGRMGQDGAPGMVGPRGDIGDTPPLEGLKVPFLNTLESSYFSNNYFLFLLVKFSFKLVLIFCF